MPPPIRLLSVCAQLTASRGQQIPPKAPSADLLPLEALLASLYPNPSPIYQTRGSFLATPEPLAPEMKRKLHEVEANPPHSPGFTPKERKIVDERHQTPDLKDVKAQFAQQERQAAAKSASSPAAASNRADADQARNGKRKISSPSHSPEATPQSKKTKAEDVWRRDHPAAESIVAVPAMEEDDISAEVAARLQVKEEQRRRKKQKKRKRESSDSAIEDEPSPSSPFVGGEVHSTSFHDIYPGHHRQVGEREESQERKKRKRRRTEGES